MQILLLQYTIGVRRATRRNGEPGKDGESGKDGKDGKPCKSGAEATNDSPGGGNAANCHSSLLIHPD